MDLPYPKGVLLVGIPGCGKSLAAKALAKQWSVPLIKCDLGKLFGGYVGDTENNTRKALSTAEAMAPCVLWIDEIEKGLAGANSSGRKRFRCLIKNVLQAFLPGCRKSLLRYMLLLPLTALMFFRLNCSEKEDFDEIFFVDLPTEEERREIVKIQLEKVGRTFEEKEIEEIAKACDGFYWCRN